MAKKKTKKAKKPQVTTQDTVNPDPPPPPKPKP
jgi:hypothetical protein